MTETEAGGNATLTQSFGRRQPAAVITDARSATSAEMATRIRRYTITMAFRTACFISMIFVPGPFRWVLFACAVALPYVAVVFANQANQRNRGGHVQQASPSDAPQLTAAEQVDVIDGDVLVEHQESSAGRRVA